MFHKTFKPIKMTPQRHRRNMGFYYGYPKCCISAFVNNKTFKRTEEQERVHESKGFIPCQKCALKIIEGKETLETLIKNRKCKTKFPIDNLNQSK